MIEQNQQSAVDTSILSITPAASAKVSELLAQEKENDPEGAANLALRIFVAGGGCSGLQYGMTLDEEQDGDTVITQGEFKVLVDEMSLGYINGSEVDYVQLWIANRFRIYRFGVRLDRAPKACRIIWIDESRVDAELGKGDRELGIGAAIERARGNDVITVLGQGE